jgi:hypothetical protein
MIFLAHSKLFHCFKNGSAPIATDWSGYVFKINVNGLAWEGLLAAMIAGDSINRFDAGIEKGL